MTWISYEPSPTKRKLFDDLARLRQQPIAHWIPRSVVMDRAQYQGELAYFGFRVLGAEARAAIPALAEIANDPQKTNAALRATSALGHIGPLALSALVGILTKHSATTRAQAAYCIVEFGTNAMPALPVLTQCLADTNQEVAITAIRALGFATCHDEEVFEPLTRTLDDPRPDVRLSAVQSLWRFGPRAAPCLERALGDPSFVVRGQATIILQDVAPSTLTNATVFATATNSLISPDAHLRAWAAKTLGRFGQHARSQLPALKHCFEDPAFLVRYTATNTIRHIAPEALTNGPPE